MGRPKTIHVAAENGDKLAILEALESKLAREIDSSKSGRDIAAMSRQLLSVLNELEELKSKGKKEKVSSLNEMKNKFKVAK